MIIGNEKDPHRYDDLLDRSRPESGKYAKMPREDRAAQFAPFAALTGYGEVIREMKDMTESEILTEDLRSYGRLTPREDTQ